MGGCLLVPTSQMDITLGIERIKLTPNPATMDGVKSDKLENGVEMPK